MDFSWLWEWDAVVWSQAITVLLARLSILWAGSGLSLGWVLVCTVADEYPVEHICVCRSDDEGYTLGVRWNRRCVRRAAYYGVLRCNARVSDSEEDDAAWGRSKRSSNYPVVTVERSTPHVVVSSDVTARAAAAVLLVSVDDNGNHFDECCVRSMDFGIYVLIIY